MTATGSLPVSIKYTVHTMMTHLACTEPPKKVNAYALDGCCAMNIVAVRALKQQGF